jgi:uncharacterized membrane protein YqiK
MITSWSLLATIVVVVAIVLLAFSTRIITAGNRDIMIVIPGTDDAGP